MRCTMPGPELAADARERAAAMVQQRVDQRAVAGARGRMHDQPRRLVDDDEIGVLVDDRKRDRLGAPSRSGRGSGRLTTTSVPGISRSRGSASGVPSAAATRALADQRLQPRAAERERLWHRGGQRLIKAVAGDAQHDAKLTDRLGHGQSRDPGEDFPEPPRLRRLRRLVTALTATLIVGRHNNRGAACHPPLAAAAAPRAAARGAAAGGRERRARSPSAAAGSPSSPSTPRGQRAHPRPRRATGADGQRPRSRRRPEPRAALSAFRTGVVPGSDRQRTRRGDAMTGTDLHRGARHRPLLGLPTGAEHLYLVYRELGTGAEYVLRSGPTEPCQFFGADEDRDQRPDRAVRRRPRRRHAGRAARAPRSTSPA